MLFSAKKQEKSFSTAPNPVFQGGEKSAVQGYLPHFKEQVSVSPPFLSSH
jgi:hypothetical protein